MRSSSWRTRSLRVLLLDAPDILMGSFSWRNCSLYVLILDATDILMRSFLSHPLPWCAPSWCTCYLDALFLFRQMLSWCTLSLDAPPDLMRSLLPPLFSWCVLFLDASTLYAPTLYAPTLDAPTLDAPTLDAPTFDAPSWSVLTDRQTNVVFYFINCLKIR